MKYAKPHIWFQNGRWLCGVCRGGYAWPGSTPSDAWRNRRKFLMRADIGDQ